MESLKQIFSIKKKRSPLMRGIEAAQVIEFLQKLLIEKWGGGIMQDVKILHLKNRVITIACLNSSVANEIRFQEKRLIDEIGRRFTPETVSQFKYML